MHDSIRELEARRGDARAATVQATIAGCFSAFIAIMARVVLYIGPEPVPVLDRVVEGIAYLCIGSALALFLLAAIKRSQRQRLDRMLADRS